MPVPLERVLDPLSLAAATIGGMAIGLRVPERLAVRGLQRPREISDDPLPQPNRWV